MMADLPDPVSLPEGDVAQVILLKPTFDWLQKQLRQRGLFLFEIPAGGDDDLPTFGVGVGQQLWDTIATD